MYLTKKSRNRVVGGSRGLLLDDLGVRIVQEIAIAQAQPPHTKFPKVAAECRNAAAMRALLSVFFRTAGSAGC
jgi:hypothetical protein